jgi:hypothetical protein
MRLKLLAGILFVTGCTIQAAPAPQYAQQQQPQP